MIKIRSFNCFIFIVFMTFIILNSAFVESSGIEIVTGEKINLNKLKSQSLQLIKDGYYSEVTELYLPILNADPKKNSRKYLRLASDLMDVAIEIQLHGVNNSKFVISQSLVRHALKIRETVLGFRHQKTLECMNELALTMEGQREFIAARPLISLFYRLKENLNDPMLNSLIKKMEQQYNSGRYARSEILAQSFWNWHQIQKKNANNDNEKSVKYDGSGKKNEKLNVQLYEHFKFKTKYKELIALRDKAYVRIVDYSNKFKSVDKRLIGIINYGNELSKISIQEDWDLDSITVKNPNYWRALMEIEKDDPSIFFSKAYLCAIKSYLSQARIWLFLGRIGMSKEYYSDYKKLHDLIDAAENQIEKDIQKGIALHDQKKFQEAIKIYDDIILNYPFSAWVYYEKAFSLYLDSKTIELDYMKELYKKSIECFPFFPNTYLVKGGNKDFPISDDIRQTFLSDIYPFVHEGKTEQSDMIRFAHGCEKLKLYDIAAHTFWILGKDRKLPNNFKKIEDYIRNLNKLELRDFVAEILIDLASEHLYEPTDVPKVDFDLTALDNKFKELYERGLYNEAQEVAEKSVKMAESRYGLDHINMASPLHNLGLINFILGKYNAAESQVINALKIQEKYLNKNDSDIGFTLNTLGAIYKNLGRYSDAEKQLNRSIKIMEEAYGPDDIDVVNICNNLASLYLDQGKFDKAEPLILRSLKAYGIFNDIEKFKSAMNSIDLVKINFKLNQNSFEKNEYYSMLGISNTPSISGARILNQLAYFYEKRGKYFQSELCSFIVLDIYKDKLDLNHPDIAHTLDNIANCYDAEKRYDEAESVLRKALKIREEAFGHNHPIVAYTLNNLAHIYANQRKYSEAMSFLKNSLAIREKVLGPDHIDVATVLNNISRVLYFQGDYVEAEYYLERALRIRKNKLNSYHPLLSLTIYNMGKLKAALGKTQEAISLLKHALVSERNILDNLLSISSLQEKAELSMEVYYKSIELVSLVAQMLANNTEGVRTAYDSLMVGKGIMLDALLHENIAQFETNNPYILSIYTQQLNDVNSKISSLVLTGPVDSLEEFRSSLSQLTILQMQLEREISRLIGSSSNTKKDIESITKALPKDSVLIEYTMCPIINFNTKEKIKSNLELHYIAFVIYPDEKKPPVLIDLGKKELIDNAIHAFYQQISKYKLFISMKVENEAERLLIETGRKVYELTFAPLKSFIGKSTLLYLAPDSELNLIPFESLHDDNDQYLLESYNIVYLSSGKDLIQISLDKTSGTGIVVIADPDYDLNLSENIHQSVSDRKDNLEKVNLPISDYFKNVKWKALSGTRLESEAITKEFPEENIDLFIGTQALKKVLSQIKSPQILHIATHGFFINDQDNNARLLNDFALRGSTFIKSEMSETKTLPSKMKFHPLLYTGLVFAGANNFIKMPLDKNNGILTALEITGLSLWGTSLAVLSACDTGTGIVLPGDGIIGIRRAFQLAGAKNLLMSLWKVDDKATASFMKRFYRYIRLGMSNAQALNKTKIWMKNNSYHRDEFGNTIKHNHPFFWASFILAGPIE